MPGIRKCEKLPLDTKQISKGPKRPPQTLLLMLLVSPIPNSSLKLQIGDLWPTQTAVARSRTARQLQGQ
eukprot:876977-Pelagomonas_calceolata.AAC.1